MNRIIKNFRCNSSGLHLNCYQKLNLVWLLLALFITLFSSAQSGWTRDKGELWAQFSASPWASSRYFNPTGQQLRTTTYQQTDVSLYAEYGLFKRFTIIGNMPVFKLQGYKNTENVSGIGDLRLELKYGILKAKFPLSLAVATEFPTGNTLAFARQLSNPVFTINLPLGDGEFNVWTTLAGSHSFSSSVFATLYCAYNVRTHYKSEVFSDQLKPGFEIGKQFKGKIWLIAKGHCLLPTQSTGQSIDFIRQNGTAYSSYSLFLLLPLHKGLGITLQESLFADFPVRRKNLYSPAIFTAGIFYHLEK